MLNVKLFGSSKVLNIPRVVHRKLKIKATNFFSLFHLFALATKENLIKYSRRQLSPSYKSHSVHELGFNCRLSLVRELTICLWYVKNRFSVVCELALCVLWFSVNAKVCVSLQLLMSFYVVFLRTKFAFSLLKNKICWHSFGY